jgi:hypothetical protein
MTTATPLPSLKPASARPAVYGVFTVRGVHLTDGLLAASDTPDAICLTDLTKPGALLLATYGRGESEFMLSADAAPPRRMRLVRSAWLSNGRRLCRFVPA